MRGNKNSAICIALIFLFAFACQSEQKQTESENDINHDAQNEDSHQSKWAASTEANAFINPTDFKYHVLKDFNLREAFELGLF